MAIKIQRQTASASSASPPSTLPYGELACDKTAVLYVGNSSNYPVKMMDTNSYNQVGNPNLGTNTNFSNPINQRGATSYTGDSTSPYCIDRWRVTNGTTYNIASRALTASSYANRACGLWQSNELAQQALAIGSTITFSGYINGMQHSGTIKILNRDLYSSFAEVPAGYECDDFEIVCCTALHEQSKYNLGIYPKKEAVLNWIKWEKGLYATPYVPKGYGAELAECLRYYQTIAFSVGLDRATYKYIPTLIPMRTTPTCTLQQIAASGTLPTISTNNLYITASLATPHYFDGFAFLSADL